MPYVQIEGRNTTTNATNRSFNPILPITARTYQQLVYSLLTVHIALSFLSLRAAVNYNAVATAAKYALLLSKSANATTRTILPLNLNKSLYTRLYNDIKRRIRTLSNKRIQALNKKISKTNLATQKEVGSTNT